MPTDAADMPPKPNTPDINAIIRNVKAQPNMMNSFLLLRVKLLFILEKRINLKKVSFIGNCNQMYPFVTGM